MEKHFRIIKFRIRTSETRNLSIINSNALDVFSVKGLELELSLLC